MTAVARLLEALAGGGVAFVIVGGVAATVHGSVRLTQDLDLVYDRSPENLRRLVAALAPFGPYLRGAPPGLPFRLDERTMAAGLNFTLSSAAGDLDLLGEITGGGGFAALRDHTIEIRVFGVACRVLDLDTLIAVKRAAGRPKDLESLAELESLRDERGRADAGAS